VCAKGKDARFTSRKTKLIIVGAKEEKLSKAQNLRKIPPKGKFNFFSLQSSLFPSSFSLVFCHSLEIKFSFFFSSGKSFLSCHLKHSTNDELKFTVRIFKGEASHAIDV
jgi:hypothetical protein